MSEPTQDHPNSALVVQPSTTELAVLQPPELVLQEAARAAAALQDVINNKPQKVIINGKQYLECEDWQTIGRFYQCTARLVYSRFVELADHRGFEARHEIVNGDGRVIGAGEGLCLDSELQRGKKRWAEWHHMKSMAQTRSESRAFQSIFRWVVVLAGYAGTPAEEMHGVGNQPPEERGSAVAQKGVVDQKLGRAKPQEFDYGTMIDQFSRMKGMLLALRPAEGLQKYYEILSEHGVVHSNQIPSRATGNKIWMVMEETRRKWEKEDAAMDLLEEEELALSLSADEQVLVTLALTQKGVAPSDQQEWLRHWEGTKDELLADAKQTVEEQR